MEEIEVKILEISINDVVQKLEYLGAKNVFDGQISASYFDNSDNTLSNSGTLLRLRKKCNSLSGSKIELTLKEQISKEQAKIMKEYGVKVDNYDVMKHILMGSNLKEHKAMTKHRISYILDTDNHIENNKIHFELDTFPSIPTFLEIEAPTLEQIKLYVTKLGFSMKDTKPWSGADVLKYYGMLD